jgi:cobalt-zinc-cadmium efflux system outer membrane protein
MRSVLLCASLAVLACPLGARAQSTSLSETEALARLSADSPRVRAIRAAVAVAEADVLVAGRWPNPRVSFGREAAGGASETMATVAQPLPITGRRGLEIESARSLVEANRARIDDVMRRARADLRLAFAQLTAAQQREAELSGTRDRLGEFAETLARREAAGDAAGFDRLRAERELADVEMDLAASSLEKARAQGVMAGFFDGTVDPLSLVANGMATTEGARAPIPDLATLMQRAESTRGELLALGKEVEAASLSSRAASRRNVPEPELMVGAKTTNGGTGKTGSVVAVQAVLPLFDQHRPETALAQARATLATARAEAFRISLRTEVAALRMAVESKRLAADRYRTQAVSTGATLARIAQVSYEAGERSLLELLDAYRVGASARLRQVDLDEARREAEIELEYATGWEMP